VSEAVVDITLPDGGLATVPEADLGKAIAAGAHVTTEKEQTEEDFGGLAGKLSSAALGAGRVATMGLSDALMAEAGNVFGPLVGQDDLRGDVLRSLQSAREVNPYSTMAGEAGGLLLGAGGIGGAVESGVAARLGEGLLGRAASMGARGAAEGAYLGAQHQITEDTLGDHAYNGEALFASAAKDALVGLAGGAVLGAGSHYLSGAPSGLLTKSRGPASDAVLDEVAGVSGAGRRLEQDIKAQQTFIDDLRKTGATSEQAATVADAIKDAAKTRTAGPASGFIDDLVERSAQWHGARSPEAAQIIRQQYARTVGKAADWETVLDNGALKMSKDLTGVLRNAEDVVNDVQFTQKPGQFAKLVDTSRTSLQADAVASAMQDMDGVLSHWESLNSKGGAEGAIKSLRKSWKDTMGKLAGVSDDEGGTLGRDLYIGMDKTKRQLDSFLRWGREHRFGLPEAIGDAEHGLEPLADRMRGMLEDESVWGRAGPAQARWNKSFSDLKARRDYLVDQAGVAIDQSRGIRIREGDFKKVRGMLSELSGGESDGALQSVKSVETFVDGMRDRIAAIREFGEIDSATAKKLVDGERALDQLEATWKATRAEAATVNRLKAAALEERESGGPTNGLLGMISTVMTKPVTTAKRLAQIRGTVAKVEEGLSNGIRKSFGGGGAAEKIKTRSKDAIAAEMESIRAVNGNPMAKEDRIATMVGDLRTHAPKIATAVSDTAARAFDYLAREAPRASVPVGISALQSAKRTKPRYSEQQLSDWEAKRNAAFHPESVVEDVKRGKLNRDAIKTVEFVSPKMFAKLQEMALEEMERLSAEGKLDNMPYQKRAAIATLLKIPADETWTTEFIKAMQDSKQTPAPEQAAPTGGPAPVAKRPMKLNPVMFATEASMIESGGV